MDSNYFLQSTNTAISQNMKFIRDYQANPDAYKSSSSSSSSSSATDSTDSMMQMMMMLMMYQMMSKMMTQMGVGLPSSTYSPYAADTTSNVAKSATAADSIDTSQNPAVAYLNQLLDAKADTLTDDKVLSLDAEDIAQVQGDLSAGQFTKVQLGQALKYELDQAPDAQVGAVGQLITDLMDTGELNIAPFLQNDYLSQLSDDRRSSLLTAVERAGFSMEGQRPNSRFIGFVLDNLSADNPNRDSQPQTQNFLKTLMQDFYDAYGNDATTPVGKIVAQIVDLGDITVGDDKTLRFS